MDTALEDVSNHCNTCLENRAKPPRTELHPWEWPQVPWSRIHIDYAGPLNNYFFLIIIDATSKWVEIFKTKSITSASTIGFLRTVYARWGFPLLLVSDNATAFRSFEFKEFTNGTGTRHVFSSVHHQSSNGAAENMVRSFKSYLKNDSGKGSVQEQIDCFLHSYRLQPHSTTGVPPAQLMLGRIPRNKLDLMRPDGMELQEEPNLDVQGRILKKQNLQKKYYTKGTARKITFYPHDKVMTRNYGKGPKWKKCTIIRQTGPVSYQCKTDEGIDIKRHVDQMWRDHRTNSESSGSSENSEDSSEAEDDTSSESLKLSPRPSSPEMPERVLPRRSSRERHTPDRLTYSHPQP
jgi:hypothetical protein